MASDEETRRIIGTLKKWSAASHFGKFKTDGPRFYDPKIAKAVTETAREITKAMTDDQTENIGPRAGQTFEADMAGYQVPSQSVGLYNRIFDGEIKPTPEFWRDHPGLDQVLGEPRPTPPAGRCPAEVAGARLTAFTGMDGGGVIAAYDDGSLWVRPPGAAGSGVAWVREAGPAWTAAPARDRTLGLIKTRAWDNGDALAAAVQFIVGRGLSISKLKKIEVSEALARELYREHAGRPYFGNLLASVVGPCVAVVIEGEGSVQAWRDSIGPSDPARWDATTLRGIFGSVEGGNIANNGFHGSDSAESAEREIELLMPLLREAR